LREARFGEPIEHAFDVRGRGRVVHHTQADGKAAAQSRGRHKPLSGRLEFGDQPSVVCGGLLLRRPGAAAAAKARDSERGRRHELELWPGDDVALRVKREIETTVDRGPERV